MNIKVYPTKFEAYENDDNVFSVTCFDADSATIKIDTVVDVVSWDIISAEIRKCLVAMELDNGLSD